MPLTDDQRALLQLLLERGQSYADIASLLGVEQAEVRNRARAALEAMAGADPDRDVMLTDYMLGQADPIGRADAARHLQDDPEAHRMATDLRARLQVLAPGARLPNLPPTRQRREAAPQTPEPAPVREAAMGARPAALGGIGDAGAGARPSPGLSRRQTQLVVALACAAVLVVAVVLAAAGVFEGGGEDQATRAGTGASTASEDLTRVELSPTGDAKGSGVAVFARVGDQPVLQVNVADLEPSPEGSNHVIWLYNSDDQAFPLVRERVGQNGNLNGAAPIPQALISVLPQFRFIDLSLSDTTDVARELRRASRSQNVIPRYVGDSILRGEIPRSAESAQGGQSGQ
jgi:hypothetical protein